MGSGGRRRAKVGLQVGRRAALARGSLSSSATGAVPELKLELEPAERVVGI
jgi:hypothetical protein